MSEISTVLPNDIPLLQMASPNKKAQEFYLFNKATKTDYTKIMGLESHLLRRQLILKAHPQVKELMRGTSNISFYLTIILVVIQLTVAYLIRETSWPVFLLVTYVIGGTIAHTSHVLIHDYTHFIGDYPPNLLRFFAILNNVCIGLPTAMSFGKYHADHHNFLGQQLKDPDLPMEFESKYVNTKNRKAVWAFMVTLVYGLRPLFYYSRPSNKYETINFVTILIADVLIYKLLGPSVLCYLLICAFLSIGPHPMALHIYAEHYQFVNKMQTYDYMGWMNIPNLNMGYHIEHHDFPSIPWYNLPKLRAMAPEFYKHFPIHTSYIKLIYKFVMDDNFGLYHRIIRTNPKDTN